MVTFIKVQLCCLVKMWDHSVIVINLNVNNNKCHIYAVSYSVSELVKKNRGFQVKKNDVIIFGRCIALSTTFNVSNFRLQ